MKISITRALSELKLLDKKIKDKTGSLALAASVTKDHQKEIRIAYLKKGAEDFQQVKDFISRRNSIKSAIVASNSVVQVDIGGKRMTVAEAIERKQSITYDKDLCRKIREDYFKNKQNVEIQNEKIKNMADKQAEAALGSETARQKGEEYTSLVNAYFEHRKFELISIDGAEKIIEEMQNSIDEFQHEIDFVLSESNTKTPIDV
jgi:hypothetical protein